MNKKTIITSVSLFCMTGIALTASPVSMDASRSSAPTERSSVGSGGSSLPGGGNRLSPGPIHKILGPSNNSNKLTPKAGSPDNAGVDHQDGSASADGVTNDAARSIKNEQ